MSLYDQPSEVQAAYNVVFSSAMEHESNTSENCAAFIMSWCNPRLCCWGPGSIVSRDDLHRSAIFTLLHSFCDQIWYPPDAHINQIKSKYEIEDRILSVRRSEEDDFEECD